MLCLAKAIVGKEALAIAQTVNNPLFKGSASKAQAQALADLFHVSPELFLLV
jgi:hypothetical protein